MTVNELRSNLEKEIIKLGVSEDFTNNPSCISVIAEIKILINQLNMFEVADTLPVIEKDGVISFDWSKSYGEKYHFEISVPSKDEVKCVRVDEKKEAVTNKEYTSKTVIEVDSNVDEYGEMTISKYYGHANDYKKDKTYIHLTGEKKVYDENGVMREREMISNSEWSMDKSVNSLSIDSILAGKDGMFNPSNRYKRRTLLVRNMLDTAKCLIDDIEKGDSFFGIVPLNQEHGLRDMILSSGYASFPEKVVIHPLMTAEIDKTIEKEVDPRVREGLKAYSVGRENFSYDSSEDSDFKSVKK